MAPVKGFRQELDARFGSMPIEEQIKRLHKLINVASHRLALLEKQQEVMDTAKDLDEHVVNALLDNTKYRFDKTEPNDDLDTPEN